MALNKFKTLASRGATLIELVSALAIGSFVLIILASIYLSHYRISSNQNTSINTATQNKLALDELSLQIRQALAIVATCPSCGLDSTSQDILILQLWPLDPNGHPQDPLGSNYDFIEFKKDPSDPQKLIRITYPSATSSRQAATRVVATDITGLTFTYDNPDPTLASEVNVNLETSGTSFGKTQVVNQDIKVILRNK